MKFLMLAGCSAVLLVVVACKAADVATPEERLQMQAMAAERDAAAAEADRLRLLVATAEDEAEAARLEAEALAAEDASAQAAADLAAKEKEIEDRHVGGLMDWVSMALPVLAPWKMQLGALGALVAFPRSRKQLKKTVIAAGSLQMRTASMDLLKTVGLVHSNQDPLEVLRGAIKAAERTKDTAALGVLSAALAKMEADRARAALEAAEKKAA